MVAGRTPWIVACVVVSVAVGCGGSGGAERPDGVTPGFIVWTEPITDGLDANVEGVVTVSPDGCVVLRNSPDSLPGPAIWPFGATFDGTVVRTPDGVEIGDGDRVRGGGGEVEYESEYYLEHTTLAVDLDAMLQCHEHRDGWIMAFNATEPIELVDE